MSDITHRKEGREWREMIRLDILGDIEEPSVAESDRQLKQFRSVEEERRKTKGSTKEEDDDGYRDSDVIVSAPVKETRTLTFDANAGGIRSEDSTMLPTCLLYTSPSPRDS